MNRTAKRIERPEQAVLSILERVPVPVLVIGSDDRVACASAAACELFGSVAPLGLDFAKLLGLAGAAGGAALARRLTRSDERQARVDLADGRLLDCRAERLDDGRCLVVLTDVSRYVRAAERASVDALTGLANRAGLADALRDAVAGAAGGGPGLAVLCLDLDRFKSVNDTLGHAVGDALLCKVAARLRGAIGPTDVVARLGGDEFAIIQRTGPQPAAGDALAARIVDLVGRTYVLHGHMVTIGASVGIATWDPTCLDPDLLLKRSDIALYRAKAEGRGRFRHFQEAMDDEMQARRLLEIDLRRALALREFTLAYQPLVALGRDEVVGMEALLRWHHPVRGSVSPADFIPLAEEIGLIVPLGEWVLRTACREAAKWPASVSLAVNLSPAQFRSGKLVETVLSALSAAGLPADRLELEITEGTLLDDTDSVLATLNALRRLGARISMDDFGTGYSSLSYLQKFPFDKIKIDQSFVRGMDDNPECGAIVRAIATLGASLGMKTTAEGVETDAQLDRIRSVGCNQVQGYLTGRPIGSDDVAALFASIAAKTGVAP